MYGDIAPFFFFMFISPLPSSLEKQFLKRSTYYLMAPHKFSHGMPS